jgi:hypothetical protein
MAAVTLRLSSRNTTPNGRRNAMDADLDQMSREQLIGEVKKLRQGNTIQGRGD